jgi:hypothetical protein
MRDLDNVWNQRSSGNELPWNEWISEIEVLSEQQEIEMPEETDLNEYYRTGLTPLAAITTHEKK